MILVKICGDKEWSELKFGNKPITDFTIAIDMATLTRLRCKIKLVDGDGNKTRKWNNL